MTIKVIPFLKVLNKIKIYVLSCKRTKRTEKSVQKDNKSLSVARKADVDEATHPKKGIMSWSVYEEEVEAKSIKSKNKK